MTQNINNTNEYTGPKNLTAQQAAIVDDLCSTHGLDPSQISFENDTPKPIFDYEAVCALSLRLTDIERIECRMLPSRTEPVPNTSLNMRVSEAECTVTLPDGKTRTCVDSAQLGETVAGVVYDTPRKTDGLAQNRAVRRGIRSVGIDLYRAHLEFKRNGGNPVAGHTNEDPRNPIYREIHALAGELDLIVDGDRKGYEIFIAECFDGRTSAKDLNDLELRQLQVQLRAMAGQKRSRERQVA